MRYDGRWQRLLCVQLIVVSAVMTLLAAPAHRPAPGKAEGEKTGAAAFQRGEKLEYQISWANLMTAATAELEIKDRRPFYGKEAWHFQALARTVGAAMFLYELDNQFDSYADAATLASFRYEAYLKEQGKTENSVTRMSGPGLPVQDDGPMVRVQPGTRDPLGALYYLRSVDWSREKQVKTQVFNGKRLFDVEASLTQSEPVTAPAGNYTASRIELRIFERKRELAHVRFWIWIADDENRTVPLMEAEMPFGKLRVELVRASVVNP